MYEFLGKSQLTISYIKENYDKFQRNKMEWLQNNKEYSETTKRTYWILINANIHLAEKEKKKDLYDFTNEEIEETLIQYERSIKTIVMLKSIIYQYNTWAIKKGYKSNENSDDSSDKPKAFDKLATKLTVNYKTLDEFYAMIESLKCSDIDKMMLILVRYGVAGKQLVYICNLKWEDIDRENMIINLGNDVELPIDDRFVKYLERAYKCETYDYQTSTLKYIDYGYVMKVSDKSEEHMIKYNTLNTRLYAIFKNNGIPRIAFGDLVAWRMFDLLFEVLKDKGEVTYDDVKSVLIIIKGNSTMSQAQYLKERFVILKENREHLISTT